MDNIIISLGEVAINVIGICLVFTIVLGFIVAVGRILSRIFR